MCAARTRHSRPLVERRLVFSSMQAQKVVHRVFYRALRSLYSAEVILRVIAENDTVDRIEAEFEALLDDSARALREERERLDGLAEQHAVEVRPYYSNPRVLNLEIATPRAFRWVDLVESLDAVMLRLDALWFAGVIDGRSRTRSGYAWQKEVLRTGWRIVELERSEHRKARQTRKKSGGNSDGMAYAAD